MAVAGGDAGKVQMGPYKLYYGYALVGRVTRVSCAAGVRHMRGDEVLNSAEVCQYKGL